MHFITMHVGARKLRYMCNSHLEFNFDTVERKFISETATVFFISISVFFFLFLGTPIDSKVCLAKGKKQAKLTQ